MGARLDLAADVPEREKDEEEGEPSRAPISVQIEVRQRIRELPIIWLKSLTRKPDRGKIFSTLYNHFFDSKLCSSYPMISYFYSITKKDTGATQNPRCSE